MKAEDFLKELNPHSKVFEINVEYEYTKKQLLLFAELYHKAELKRLQLGELICDCGKPIEENYDPCCSLDCWNRKFMF